MGLAGENPNENKRCEVTTKTKRVWRIGLVALTLTAFAALGPAAAFGEDGAPRVLLLSGNVTNLEGTLKGGASTLETVGGLAIAGSEVEATVADCKETEGSTTDTSLCGPVTITLTGVAKKNAKCHSEMANKEEADNNEKGIVLVETDVHFAAEENSAKELQPLMLFKVLGALTGESPEELTIDCAGVLVKVRGVIGCLLTPGLANIVAGGEETLACKIKEAGKPETGTCERLCEWLTEHPFEAKIGAAFEQAWMRIEARGALSRTNDIFLDD